MLVMAVSVKVGVCSYHKETEYWVISQITKDNIQTFKIFFGGNLKVSYMSFCVFRVRK